MTHRPLPRRRSVSLPFRLCVPEKVIADTERLLRTFKSADEGRHEGLVYWLGERADDGHATVMSLIVPNSQTTPGSVSVSRTDNARAISIMGDLALRLIAQVHSHPFGARARHSPGDDRLVLMPFEGLLSVVVPDYAVDGMRPLVANGFHIFQSGTWQDVQESSIKTRVQVLPDVTDLRERT